MLPGYLHFDVRRGLRADLVNSALISHLEDHGPLKKSLDSLGIANLTYIVSEQIILGVKGQYLQFYLDSRPILLALDDSDLGRVVFGADEVSIKYLRGWLEKKALPVSTLALVLKILDQLITPVFCEHQLSSNDVLWVLCHTLAFCAQIDALDPKFISTTKICVSEGGEDSLSRNLSLNDRMWLNQILVNMPIIEVKEAVFIDVLGVAFIKALAGHMGARGDVRVLKVGIGLAQGIAMQKPILVEAHWCEANLPASINECGLSNRARLDSVHEISGAVSATSDISHLSAALSLHGANSITWHLAQRERNQSCYLVRFLVSDEDKRDAIEAFLIKGGAFDVTVSVVERHELNRRMVSVPIGTGNKASSVRFYEYIYFGKTVRVEPVKEDLEGYVQKTDYSADVARSDLMLAWKKWRGRVVSEDA